MFNEVFYTRSNMIKYILFAPIREKLFFKISFKKNFYIQKDLTNSQSL